MFNKCVLTFTAKEDGGRRNPRRGVKAEEEEKKSRMSYQILKRDFGIEYEGTIE